VLVKGWAAWALYGAFLVAVRAAVAYIIETLLAADPGRLPSIVGGAVGATFLIPMRRAVIRLRATSTAKMARDAAMDRAAAIDVFAGIDAEPDGKLVSLVGWVRGHGYLDRDVRGQRAVGLTLRCQDGVPFVLELMHNFDLVDESGNAALVLTGDGRVLGDANVRLSRASHEDRNLVVSLDLPATAVPTDWNAFVVRDGDPVMVLGTKTTIQDLEELQYNRSPNRTAIASAPGRPLLLFPIDAERRHV
jgi:hypothetical protein